MTSIGLVQNCKPEAYAPLAQKLSVRQSPIETFEDKLTCPPSLWRSTHLLASINNKLP